MPDDQHGDGAPSAPPEPLLRMIDNLARFHREHEEFYAQAPLRQAAGLQAHSRVLKALADRWSAVGAGEPVEGLAFTGAEDLNAPGLVAEAGVLFMEDGEEPAELKRIRRDIGLLADDSEQTGAWLSGAMERSWETAGSLAAHPSLADLAGERHRIIADDWQAAGLLSLIARLLRRALELLARVDFSPAALRSDLAGGRTAPAYLYSASELLDHAADLLAESAALVHGNERRWRTFRARVRELLPE
ncbi:hypothetical protein [Streptomyces sp. SS8]